MDVSHLSRDEQIKLLDQLRHEVGDDPRALPLSDVHRAVLDDRLDDLEREGAFGICWGEVVSQIRARSR